MEEELQLCVDEAMQGSRVDRLLAERFPEITRSRFQKLLRDGMVTARGKKIRSAYRVLLGDEIRVRVPAPEPLTLEPEDIPLSIVHEDEALLVIDKPAGLVVHPAAGNARGTLVHALLHHLPELAGGEPFRPGIVHRLDKETSGLLVVAKNERVHAQLSAQLQVRRMRRHYVALVWGVLGDPEGTVDGAIGRHPSDRKRMAVVKHGGKPARTHFRVLERLQFATFLEVQLDTGRTHQIRVHMAARGNPVFGDAGYGGRNSCLTRLPAGLKVAAKTALNRISRQALHAIRLSFVHPVSGNDVVYESKIPDDFEEVLALMRHPASGARE